MFADLNPDHQAELSKYLKFFHQRKDQFLKERDRELKDFKKDLQDELFNREDVESLLSKYNEENKKFMEEDISLLIRMSAIYVENVLKEAENNNLEFHVDFNTLENNKVIEELKNLERKNSSFQESASLASKVKIGARLPSIYNQSPDLNQKINELMKENENLKQKNQKLQQDMINIAKDNKFVDDLSFKTEEDYKNDVKSVYKELENEKKKNDTFKKELELLKDEQNKKLSETTQVLNLKKMIQQKNDLVKNLRDRLGKYEKVDAEND